MLIVSKQDSGEEWVIDSGCSFHMCPNQSWFQEFTNRDGGTVLLGDNKACKVKGVGSIKFKLESGLEKVITDIRYVPDLKRNLLSLGMFDKQGYSIKVGSGNLRINNGSLNIMKGNLRNGVYILQGKSVQGSANTVSVDKTHLWHERLGHINERGLVELSKHDLLDGDKIDKLDFCENCALGKAKRLKYSKSNSSSTGVLDYIHSDLWGPSRVETLGGARYFISIIDDYSRKVWVYLLKTKDQAFEAFCKWEVLVENQTDRKIKKLRTDNGLEYCSNQFNKMCEEAGIARHKTVRGTPQQNGLAERMNRTILEKVRCMLSSSGLEKQFWGEAVKTACYLINRCPSTALEFRTPQELWSGRKPINSHLRVFGCSAYAHIRQDKLQPRAKKCVFLGYPEGTKGYRLWCIEPGEKGCIISREVVFNEKHKPLLKKEEKDIESKSEENENSELKVEFDQSIFSDDDISEPGNEEGMSHENEGGDLTNYQLGRDRERRTIKPPTRFGYADLIAYALTVSHESGNEEPSTYR